MNEKVISRAGTSAYSAAALCFALQLIGRLLPRQQLKASHIIKKEKKTYANQSCRSAYSAAALCFALVAFFRASSLRHCCGGSA